MKRIVAMIALGMGTAALAQTPPPAAPAKKVIVHKQVHTQTHSKKVTRTPSTDGVARTNVVKKQTVKTPTGTHTRVVTKSTAQKQPG